MGREDAVIGSDAWPPFNSAWGYAKMEYNNRKSFIEVYTFLFRKKLQMLAHLQRHCTNRFPLGIGSYLVKEDLLSSPAQGRSYFLSFDSMVTTT